MRHVGCKRMVCLRAAQAVFAGAPRVSSHAKHMHTKLLSLQSELSESDTLTEARSLARTSCLLCRKLITCTRAHVWLPQHAAMRPMSPLHQCEGAASLAPCAAHLFD